MAEQERLSDEGKSVFQILGPGLVTGASDDDPSGIGTYSQAGAQFGFSMLWALLVTWPLMSAVQEVSALIGRATGRGLAANLRRSFPAWFSMPLVGLLLVANVLNIGADLGAMGAAMGLLVGGPTLVYDLVFAGICFAGAALFSYERYSSILKWLSLILLSYVVTAFVVHVPWGRALRETVIPSVSLGPGYVSLLVGVLGTTISPYLFFWQASEEAEQVRESPEVRPLNRAPEQVPGALRRIRIDTYIGMFLSNAVAWFIMVVSAVTLHDRGHTTVQSAAEAASALRPLGGQFAFLLFAAGIVGTGLLAVPVLAGSAAFGVGELARKPVGINLPPRRAPLFYGVFALATAIGLALNFTRVNPIQALVWSAVINGVVAVPVMVGMMLIARNSQVMGPLKRKEKTVRVLGWVATALMLVAVVAMFVEMARG